MKIAKPQTHFKFLVPFINYSNSSEAEREQRIVTASSGNHGTDCVLTELHAKKYPEQHSMIYVSPYNDLQIIGEQVTIGVELMKQLENSGSLYFLLNCSKDEDSTKRT